MPHIKLPENVPGIIGPLMVYTETEGHINALTQALLRGPSSLAPAERETIAAFVSSGNECYFCTQCHAAAARALSAGAGVLVDQVLADVGTAAVSEKMKALLSIADKVRRDGRLVTNEDIARARTAGADDKAIHDTVLIAAAFCMFNRYVDGLATWTPREPAVYKEIGERLATKGYQSNAPVNG
jgi:uncharacterized peroxidase-related enzyme